MQIEETVFEKSYKDYLAQIKQMDFYFIAPKLGAQTDGKTIKLKMFNLEYQISGDRILGPSGERPHYDVCVILSKYLLLCPDIAPTDNRQISFKDLKDSGPLINYFTNDVEHAVVSYFSGNMELLKKAASLLGSYPPSLDVKYDIAVQFDALPMIPLVLLFNEADDEFPAKCTVLFNRSVEKYLDAECIAMLGRQMYLHLKKFSPEFCIDNLEVT